ncbi:uncharacterized protein LOC105429849 isoform X2 [Pogonomyrmex barbatus]|uniref:Uncharacterized protein LOC105429849 isoform X2 n=1 Tax=Pogonomyrmex barbatus TaxID=144034 RepID=A0A6I9WFN2_9HYME|nr:uncharacterized protein LOC105429849 isoform X2 [Pogonomyrmex barbatus]
MERVKAINKYYVHLEYNNVTNTSVEINKLFNKMLLKQKVSHIKRMEILSFMIEKNFSLFVSLYKHIDVVMAIIRYLYNISEKFKDDVTYPTYNNDSEYGLVMIITILLNIRKDISAQMLIQSFLVMALQKPIDMLPENEIFFHEYEHICEMIILKDSDLHAIINCLKITENYNFIKIWVQEPVIKKFLWFTKKYNNLDLSSSIHTFQSLKDIKLCAYNDFSINIVSIWSENILAAKNFALSLNKCTVFINSYMEYDGDLMFLPYLDIYYRKKKEITFNLRCKINSDKSDLIESKK